MNLNIRKHTPLEQYGLTGKLIEEIKVREYSYQTSKIYISLMKRFLKSKKTLRECCFSTQIKADQLWEMFILLWNSPMKMCSMRNLIRNYHWLRRVGIRVRETNNVVERLHGTLKGRLKPLRDLKTEETAKIWLDNWFVYYNFLRPHLSFRGKTSAEACGINLKLENSWENLIRKATYYQTKLTRFVSTETGTQVQ